MALVINHNSLNGKGFLLQLGFTPDVLASLLSKDWDVKLTAKTVTLFKDGGGGHQVPVDLTLLNGVNAGTLPFAQKGPLLAALKSAVQAALLDLPSATHGLNPSVSAIQPEQAGGLSGSPVLNASNRVIGQLRAALGKGFPIIGVGGVMSGADAVSKINAGADVVQIYTGLIYKGPGLVSQAAKAIKVEC